MEYCLDNNNKILALYRELFPMDESSKERIKRSSNLRLQEIILAHYEVNPFLFFSLQTYRSSLRFLSVTGNQPDAGYSFIQSYLQQLVITLSTERRSNPQVDLHEFFSRLNIHPKLLEFKTFVDMVDYCCCGLTDGFLAKDHKDKNVNRPKDELISKEEYVKFSMSQNLSLPSFMKEKVPVWDPKLATILDVKKIDYDNLSPSVLASLGCNVFAQSEKRANPKIEISKIYASNLVKKFLQNCAVAEGADMAKAQDTVREYIEHQFFKQIKQSKA